MNSTIAVTTRRIALALTVAGIAALGGFSIAPAASAAEASGSIILRDGEHGPAAFVILENGRQPVFECDADHPHKQATLCIDMDGPTRFCRLTGSDRAWAARSRRP